MKGYIQIEVSKEFKSKLFELVNKINGFDRKNDDEVIVWEKTPWWKFVYKEKYTVLIPDELTSYFTAKVYDKEYYCFYKTDKTERVGELYHLILAGNPVYLGEQLARVYNKLKKEFEV